MINKLKNIVTKNFEQQDKILAELKILKNLEEENLWSQIYHDSTRGIKPIEELNLNIGRWAGNYSFFYVLNRILSDYKPLSILELGLGESTKFVSTYIRNFIPSCNHVVVEQSEEWIVRFKNKFELTSQTKIEYLPLEKRKINDFEVTCYKGFNEKIKDKFQLYIVDGPFGSDRFSRFDIVSLVNKFDKNDFIIMFDDTNRVGERDTVEDIKSILDAKKINYYHETYAGNKSVTVIASEKFKYTTSL